MWGGGGGGRRYSTPCETHNPNRSSYYNPPHTLPPPTLTCDVVVRLQLREQRIDEEEDELIALVKELWEALKSGGTHIIDVKFKPILEGANFGNAEFKMPKLKLTDVQNQIDEIDKRMVAREAERGAKNAPAGAPKAGPNAPAGVAAAANSGKIGVTDAESYARELQEGALKSNKIQEGQLDQLKTIATNTGKLIGALGAGASRSPVAAAFG